jgi:acetyl-CoA carboxylase carboxyltransferase component
MSHNRETKEQNGLKKAAPQKESKAVPGAARARLQLLFDPGTFEEIDAGVVHRTEAFGLADKRVPGDGVVCGVGEVEGRTLFAFSQDRAVLGGSLGEYHARKICKVMDLAAKNASPLVGICDSGGARIQEGVDALGGYGEIFRRNVALSGVVPQISLVLGPCAGGAVYSPALTDFVVMVDEQSYMFLTGPKVVKTVTFEDISVEELGGGKVHAEKTGVAHFLADDEVDAITRTRRLLSYLPDNCQEAPPEGPKTDASDRRCEGIEELVPRESNRPYDVHKVLEVVLDRGSFFEVHEAFAQNVVVGFGRLGGQVVGIIANNPAVLAGCLDIDSSRKAGRFVRTCNAFKIPIVSFVDVPGFLPGRDQEHGGAISHGAKLLYAYCEATVPKLSVILRKAYGGAYIVMSSKHVGGDINLAWPRAEVAVMGGAGARARSRSCLSASSTPPRTRTPARRSCRRTTTPASSRPGRPPSAGS